MKYKIKISVEHNCTHEFSALGDDSIEHLLEILEKHSIPFELTSSIEATSTRDSVIVKPKGPLPQTSDKP